MRHADKSRHKICEQEMWGLLRSVCCCLLLFVVVCVVLVLLLRFGSCWAEAWGQTFLLDPGVCKHVWFWFVGCVSEDDFWLCYMVFCVVFGDAVDETTESMVCVYVLLRCVCMLLWQRRRSRVGFLCATVFVCALLVALNCASKKRQ